MSMTSMFSKSWSRCIQCTRLLASIKKRLNRKLKLEKIKIVLILLMSITIVGCDPTYEHEFQGKIIEQESGKPINNAKLEYTFYPIENLNHWRAKVTHIDSIQFTNERGEFENNFKTLTLTFDSLKVRVIKEGYKEKVLNTENDNWNSIFSRMKFRYDFGKIKLEKIKIDTN